MVNGILHKMDVTIVQWKKTAINLFVEYKQKQILTYTTAHHHNNYYYNYCIKFYVCHARAEKTHAKWSISLSERSPTISKSMTSKCESQFRVFVDIGFTMSMNGRGSTDFLNNFINIVLVSITKYYMDKYS